MALIEKSRVLRKIPTGGTNDAIGTLRLIDPITGDEITQEQFGSVGYPTRFVKVAAAAGTVGSYFPDKGSITIAANADPNVVQFSGALACNPVGLLLSILQAGTNQYQVRKIISLNAGNTYNLNTPLLAGLGAADTYDLYIDTFRFNALYIKPEFSTTTLECDIQPLFFAMNQGPENPTPSIAKPIRFFGSTYRLLNRNTGLAIEEAGYSHGSTIAIATQGALGVRIQLATLYGAGSVSLWASAV